VKASEFRERQRQEQIRDAADAHWALTTALEQPGSWDRVLYDAIFERDHPAAAVRGRAREAQKRAAAREAPDQQRSPRRRSR
jgi:hypothetical protein